MATLIKIRRGDAATWASVNPVLAEGEQGYDLTNERTKIGDGVTAWEDLPFTDEVALGVAAADATAKANAAQSAAESTAAADATSKASAAQAAAIQRANHTGTQAQSTVVDLVTDLAAKVAAANPVITGSVTAAPTAVVGGVIDITKPANSATITDSTTVFTLSATPAAGRYTKLIVSNTDDEAHFFTIPSMFSEAQDGAAITEVYVAAESELTVVIEGRASGTWLIGDTVSELPAQVNNTEIDAGTSTDPRLWSAADVKRSVDQHSAESSGIPDGDKGDITVSESGTVWELNDTPLLAADKTTSTTLTGADNTQIPSALAVKTYVDNSVAGVVPFSPVVAVSGSEINWAAGYVFTKSLGADTTFTFANVADGKSIEVVVGNSDDDWTVTWPGTVSWPGGTPPVQTVGAKTDKYRFTAFGAVIVGEFVQNYSTDLVPPSLESAVIAADGVTLTLTFSEPVTVATGDDPDWSIVSTGDAVGMEYDSGSTTTEIVFTLDRTVYDDETLSIDYAKSAGPGVTDASSNLLAPIDDFPVTNNSEETTGPGFLLDQVGSADGAWSVARKLRSAYSGPAIRVQRTSDNTETDIGFSGSALDTTALATFASGTDAYVAKIYDQSGGTLDLVQATLGNMPRIVSGGTIDVDPVNGLPMARFLDDDRLTVARTLSLPVSWFAVVTIRGTTNADQIINGNTTSRMALSQLSVGPKMQLNSGSALQAATNYSLNVPYIVRMHATSGNDGIGINDAAANVGSAGNNGIQSYSLGSTTICAAFNFQELVAYASDVGGDQGATPATGDDATIIANMNADYDAF